MLIPFLQQQAQNALSAPTTTPLVIPAQINVPIVPQVFIGTGGSGGPYTFSATGLPTGITLASNGTISGTPTQAGPFPYTVFVTDNASTTGNIHTSLTVMGSTPVPPIPPIPPVDPVTLGYTVTYAAMKSQLAYRLSDTSNIFWTDTELGLYINEGLRFFALCSGTWRERGVFQTVSSTAYYDIRPILTNGSFLLLQPTMTDRQIIQYLEYHLLEATGTQSAWAGTEMFAYPDIANSVQNRLNRFLVDSGCVINHTLVNGPAPQVGRLQLDNHTIDVRHAAWLGAFPESYYNPLWREDERMLTAADPSWSVSAGTPDSYSIMAPPPFEIQLAPPPISSGLVELLTVRSVVLAPQTLATVMGLPENTVDAVKWGALADLLGKDGIARDPIRAEYCESRYMQYVQLARMLPVVIHAELNGQPLIPSTLQELEASTPSWQNSLDQPADVITVGNLVVLNPVPDGVYSVTLDVVRNAPIPSTGSDKIRLGLEQIDMVLDYAEHVALFKVGGAEWHATERQAQNFIIEALTYNQRLSAAARSVATAAYQSQREKQETPRRINSPSGAGALNRAGS